MQIYFDFSRAFCRLNPSRVTRQNTHNMKFTLGAKDPRSAIQAAKLNKERNQIDRMKLAAKNYVAPPMPEWAIEEAITDGKRHKSKGFSPLVCYTQWPIARKHYLSAWQ